MGLCTWTGSTVSLTTHRMSKREIIGSVRSTFSEKVSEGSYRPPVTQRNLSGLILSSGTTGSTLQPQVASVTEGEENFDRGTRRGWKFSTCCLPAGIATGQATVPGLSKHLLAGIDNQLYLHLDKDLDSSLRSSEKNGHGGSENMAQ